MERNIKNQASLIAIPFNLKLNIRIILFFIFLIVFSLFIALIYQLNTYTSEIYLINQMEKEISRLSHENKILEVSLAEASSLARLPDFSQSFERTQKIEYVRIFEGTALAK